MTTHENSKASLWVDGSRSISFAASALGSLIRLEVMMSLFAIVPPALVPATRSDLLPYAVPLFHAESDLRICMGLRMIAELVGSGTVR